MDETKYRLLENLVILCLKGLKGMLSALPAISFSNQADINNAMSYLGTFLGKASFIFPVNTFVAVTGLYVAIRLGLFGFFILNWIIRRIFDLIP